MHHSDPIHPSQSLLAEQICVIIPTYNHQQTVVQVAREVLRYASQVMVVVDGSTDQTRECLQEAALPIRVYSYPKNRGKGYALKYGFLKARELGFKYALTLDSDGQHYPEDIPLFQKSLESHPQALLVGCRNLQSENMPGKNTFANKFSNFWFRVQTGLPLSDTQCGFRLYPLEQLHGLNLLTYRYEAELELLVFAAWRGVELVPQPVRVYYQPEGERISHFRPGMDFLRISVLNTLLCVGAVCYGWPMKLIRKLRRSV
jgi:glycosyltransferase involved in cell wall biosynthesis